MPLTKVSVASEAAKLKEPFSLLELAYVDDFVLSVYSCQGALVWHKHVDQDELFLVHSGVISLESEWGNVVLHSGELAVVPKGVAHRSASFLWSIVLLFHARLLVERRDGHRRLFVLGDEGRLTKVNVLHEASTLFKPFLPREVARVDSFVVEVSRCQGSSAWDRNPKGGKLFLVQEGELALESEAGEVILRAGELAVMPKGIRHRPCSPMGATLLTFQRRT